MSACQRPAARRGEISYLVERLHKVASTKLSAAEKKLARWVQIKLPPSADAEATLREIAGWPCTAEAHLAPIVSLPGPMTDPTG